MEHSRGQTTQNVNATILARCADLAMPASGLRIASNAQITKLVILPDLTVLQDIAGRMKTGILIRLQHVYQRAKVMLGTSTRYGSMGYQISSWLIPATMRLPKIVKRNACLSMTVIRLQYNQTTMAATSIPMHSRGNI